MAPTTIPTRSTANPNPATTIPIPSDTTPWQAPSQSALNLTDSILSTVQSEVTQREVTALGHTHWGSHVEQPNPPPIPQPSPPPVVTTTSAPGGGGHVVVASSPTVVASGGTESRGGTPVSVSVSAAAPIMPLVENASIGKTSSENIRTVPAEPAEIRSPLRETAASRPVESSSMPHRSITTEREGAVRDAIATGGSIPSMIAMPPTIGVPLSVVDGVQTSGSEDGGSVPPVQVPLSEGMSSTSLFSGSAGGGIGGAPGALLALSSTFAFIVWRAIQRQVVHIPSGLPQVVLTPPG